MPDNVSSESFTVFIVDDDQAMRDSLWAMLRARGIDAEVYVSGEDFLRNCRAGRLGVLLLDINMPGLSGHDVMRGLQECCVELPFIVMTGYGDIPLAVRAMKAGAFEFVEKPFDTGELVAHIERAPKELRTRVHDLTASLHDDDTVYASLNDHKSGDFTPYLFRSRDLAAWEYVDRFFESQRRWTSGKDDCSCPDFAVNTLGTCKHLLFALREP